MRNTRLAEWILSLVLPPERAASAVGDWMEDSAKRGNVWFWSCVFRAATARLWNDLAENPVELVRVGFGGYFFGLLLVAASLILMIPIMILVMIPVAILAHFLPSLPHAQEIFQIPGTLCGCAGLCVCEFQTGRWIARRAPGREMAACIASFLAPMLLFGLVELFVMHFWGSEVNQFIANHPVENGPATLFRNNFPSEIFLFAGAASVRRKTFRSPAK